MRQGPKPGTTHWGVASSHGPLGHGPHACTCSYVVTPHTTSGGVATVVTFLGVPLATPVGNVVCSIPPCSSATILVGEPPLQEGVRAGGVNAPTAQRSSQSHHQAWAKRRTEHRSLLARGSWKYPHPNFVSFQW